MEQAKADVYETWAAINRAFEQIITALDRLERKGVLKDDYVHHQSIITNYLWAKINSQIRPTWAGERRTTAITMAR